jgi:protein arginine N-methyltransferase 1
MYSVSDYGALIADKVRLNAFVAALQRTITPASVVIDIGTGTGIFALIACALGARRVYAIEANDAIEVARAIAAANGYNDRIEFHQAFSNDVSLRERGDIVVADIGGMLPWFQLAIPSIVDVRQRMMIPGGVILPERDTIWTAVVEANELYARHTAAWGDNEFAVRMEPARNVAINTWMRSRFTADQLLSPAQRWHTVDYATVTDANIRAILEWTVTRSGIGHGFAAGFDRTVLEGIEISNAPDRPQQVQPTLVYEPVFFPWQMPVALDAGDVVCGELAATLVGNEYAWSWNTRVRGGTTSETKAAFRQSTFFSAPLSLEAFKRATPEHVPALKQNGRMMLLALTLMADQRSVGDIANQLRSAYPTRFAAGDDALAYVADLVAKFA